MDCISLITCTSKQKSEMMRYYSICYSHIHVSIDQNKLTRTPYKTSCCLHHSGYHTCTMLTDRTDRHREEEGASPLVLSWASWKGRTDQKQWPPPQPSGLPAFCPGSLSARPHPSGQAGRSGLPAAAWSAGPAAPWPRPVSTHGGPLLDLGLLPAQPGHGPELGEVVLALC